MHVMRLNRLTGFFLGVILLSWYVNVLWKVVKKCKCKCFLTFRPFFSKYKFFVVAIFFLLSRPTYQLNPIFFSGSSNLHGSCYWWSIFSSLATVTIKIQKVYFSCFLVKYWKKFLQHNYAACQSKLCLLTKNYWWYVFYPFAKDPDHGVKMWQNLVLFF